MVDKGDTMKLKEIMLKFNNIIFYILAIAIIIMIILKLTNHSPTIEEVLLGFCGIILTTLFAMFYKMMKMQSEISSMKGEFRTEFKHLNQKVNTIGHDLKQHMQDTAVHTKKLPT